MTAVKDDLIRNNNTVNWMPESIGSGRFGDWLKNIQDWGVSRSRYWGTPLNIWECECGHTESIGSIEELKQKSPDCPENIELHRPFIDGVHVTCPKCGKLMKRVPDVIDCWFSITILLKIRNTSRSISRQTLSVKVLTRQEAGSTL